MSLKKPWLTHLIICITFLGLPVLLTPPHRDEFGKGIGNYLIVRKEVANVLLLVFFYINYLYILPLYFKKKYFVFGVIIAFCLVLLIVPEFILDLFTSGGRHGAPPNVQNTFFLFFMVFFISYSIKMNARFKEAESEKQQAQISLLKAQVNPHFLFNTLNSIYVLALKNSTDTARSVVKLSNMLRYSLTETATDFVALSDEFSFVENYIALQKMRLGTTCSIVCEINNNTTNDRIIPMVLIPFIENAFKYGVSVTLPSEIKIKLQNIDGVLQLKVRNSKRNCPDDNYSTGIGVANTRRRLNMYYDNRHSLEISDNDDDFYVQLNIFLR